jgi:hypothetical protein
MRPYAWGCLVPFITGLSVPQLEGKAIKPHAIERIKNTHSRLSEYKINCTYESNTKQKRL